MRFYVFTFRFLVLLSALMVWQAKSAYACNHEGSTYKTAIHSSDLGSSTSHSETKTKPVGVISAYEHQSMGCNGSCCHCGPCCSAIGLINQSHISFIYQKAIYLPSMAQQFVPPGSPYPLLRPPIIFA